jgi:hypothetical protein
MQTAIVLLIVLAAAAYSVWRLAPATLRQRLASHSGALARAGGASDALARRIEIKAIDAANAGSCGNCGPCKACGTGKAEEQA